LGRCAIARCATAAALATPPGAAATTAGRTDGTEPLPVTLAVAAALARGAEPFDVRAAAARLVLLAEAHVLLGVETAVPLRHDLALVDPDLHADAAEGRLRLDEPVVDVGADRVQRNAALGVHLGAAHLRPAQPAAADDLDPVRAGPDPGRERALHRPPEADAVLELLGD